ncbi:hypothetical protein DdX_08323 [Ditylenchus destructor]|uniref:Uncharacterized protein n=1 Tax=Ditylenchus destructor TaxID=166010 RepID=A0AAD4R163_9BILA|nr:hypothetical protein DdX_08323 [Ditylenchus destructor]
MQHRDERREFKRRSKERQSPCANSLFGKMQKKLTEQKDAKDIENKLMPPSSRELNTTPVSVRNSTRRNLSRGSSAVNNVSCSTSNGQFSDNEDQTQPGR